jgi:hypothetical protein
LVACASRWGRSCCVGCYELCFLLSCIHCRVDRMSLACCKISWNQFCWLRLPNYVLLVFSRYAANRSVRFVMLSIAQWILNCLFNRPPGSLPEAFNRHAFLKSLCSACWPHKQTTYLLVWTLEITSPNVPVLHYTICVHGLILTLSWRSFFCVYLAFVPFLHNVIT